MLSKEAKCLQPQRTTQAGLVPKIHQSKHTHTHTHRSFSRPKTCTATYSLCPAGNTHTQSESLSCQKQVQCWDNDWAFSVISLGWSLPNNSSDVTVNKKANDKAHKLVIILPRKFCPNITQHIYTHTSLSSFFGPFEGHHGSSSASVSPHP